jgi:DNA polymerase elongation subunit (family B)
MYNAIYYDRKEETVHILDDENGYICKNYKDFAFRKKTGGPYKSLWGDELERTTNFFNRDPSVLESDLPIETKILVEMYRDEDTPSKTNSVVLFDIETDSTGGFPNIKTADKEVTAITLYDMTTKKYHTLILDKQSQIQDVESDTDSLKSFKSEPELLSYFLSLWEQICPTVVSAWNGDGFDIPYITKRISVVLGDSEMKRMSPIGVVYYNTRKQQMVIGCVSCLDYMILYKKFRFEPRPQYSLNFIGNVEFGKGKIQYEGSLNDLFKKDLKKYIEYNKFDVELLRMLDEKFKFIQLAIGICHIGHVPYEWFGMSSRFIEGAIIVYMRKHGNLVAPNKPHEYADVEDIIDKDDDDEDETDADIYSTTIQNKGGFKGAFVKEPVPGLYEWVISVDINSLYPSCIRTMNISPETYIGKIVNWDIEKFLKAETPEYKIGNATYTHDQIKELFQDKITIGANGALYDTKVKGIIPSILDVWFDQRVEFKKLSKKYEKEGNKELAEFYDRRQHIQKIFLNSVYGILGLSVSRFYSKDNAEAVTISGQNIIKTTEKIVISYFKEKFASRNKNYTNDANTVVYIDTDSNYISLLPLMELESIKQDDRKDYSINTSSEIIDKINKMYVVMSKKFFNSDDNKIRIVGESLCDTAFWVAKKKYSLHVVYNLEDKKDVDKIKTKGIEFIKSSFPIKFSKFGNDLLVSILKKRDKKDVDNDILTFVENLKTLTPLDVAKNTSVKFTGKKGDKMVDLDPKTRTPFSYIKGSTAQCKSALTYNDLLKLFGLDKKIEPIYSGGKIKWVYLRQNHYNIDAIAFKSDGTDPKEILEIIETYVDRRGLYEHELKNKLEDFYNALKWDFPTKSKIKSKEFFD